MKKTKKKINLSIILGVTYFVYLVFDVIHFLMFRLEPNYLPLGDGYYENSIISYIKWLFCILILGSLYLNFKNIKASFYIIWVSIIGILILYILKGQWNYMLMGSFVFKIHLLELGAFATLFLTKKLKHKYKIKISFILSFIVIISLLLFLIIYKIPVM